MFANVGEREIYERANLDKSEAPAEFYAALKSKSPTENSCMDCDARKLCCDNIDGWCFKNRCSAYARKDGCSVYYKRIDKIE